MNLTDVFYRSNQTETVRIRLTEAEFEELAAGVRGLEDVRLKEAAEVTLSLEHTEKGKALIKGFGTMILEGACSRCLEPVPVSLPLDFCRIVYAPEAIPDEEQKEEQQFLTEYELDAKGLILEELCLSVPVKLLCREDCRGICKKCGQNLNQKDCGCDDFVPDIRLAGLMDLFQNSST